VSEDHSNRIPAVNSSSSRPRLLRVRAESCYIGERELSLLTDEGAGSVSSCGEVLLLEYLSGRTGVRKDFQAEWFGGLPVEEGKILLSEFSLDTNVALQLDYSCLLNGTFKAIVAPFFGMQILSLASKCGVLLVPLPIETIKNLRACQVRIQDGTLEIDLTSQVIRTCDSTQIEFQTAPWHRDRLLSGMDDTDEVLALKEARENFLQSDKKLRPWLYS
jgi:hypothetical protein